MNHCLIRRFLCIVLSMVIFITSALNVKASYVENLTDSLVNDVTDEILLVTCDEEEDSTETGTEFIEGYTPELLSAYEEFCAYLETGTLEMQISLENFSDLYESGEYESEAEFLAICIEEVEGFYLDEEELSLLSSSLSPGDVTWQYNTSGTLYEEPDYTTYNLLNVVQAGDILYEGKTSFGTGHVAIVEGIYYSTTYAQYYIQIIESIGYNSDGEGCADGVCRGILDDVRFEAKAGKILRVSGASDTEKAEAVAFCVAQIGKPYSITLNGGASSSNSTWYCSELVWAAYYNQGYNIDNDKGFLVTPLDIKASSLTKVQTVTTIGMPVISKIVANSTTSVTISWSEVSGATKYYVYRSTSANGTYSLIEKPTATSYTDTGLTAGSNYYYRIAAYNSSGLGNKSAVKGIRLVFGIPIVTSVQATSSTSVYLEWTTIYAAGYYYVYRTSSASGTYTKIATTSNCYYTDTGLTSGTTYYYKIVAANASSTTEYSIFKTVKPAVVNTPVFYYSCVESSTSVTIRWSYISNATKYYVYRSTSSSGTYIKIATTTKTTYTDTGLDSGTTYYYKIRAYNGSTYSSYSNSKIVTPK